MIGVCACVCMCILDKKRTDAEIFLEKSSSFASTWFKFYIDEISSLFENNSIQWWIPTNKKLSQSILFIEFCLSTTEFTHWTSETNGKLCQIKWIWTFFWTILLFVIDRWLVVRWYVSFKSFASNNKHKSSFCSATRILCRSNRLS